LAAILMLSLPTATLSRPNTATCAAGGSAVALHDLAAPAIVVTEAGGRFTSLDGADGPAGGTAVATNGLLHDEVLRRLES
jgi:histidinol-phosphatase